MKLFVLRSKSHLLTWILYAMAIISITFGTGCRNQSSMMIPNTESSTSPDKYQLVRDTAIDISINHDTIKLRQNNPTQNAHDSNKKLVIVKKDTLVNRVKDTLKNINPIHAPVCEYGVKPNYR